MVTLDENYNGDRLNIHGDNCDNDRDGRAFEIALVPKTNKMKTYKRFYETIYSEENLNAAWRKARKGKNKKICC